MTTVECDECKEVRELRTFVETYMCGITRKELCEQCYETAEYEQFAIEWFIGA
ncbi:hypothetical protein [Paenibacillus sp. Marseille-Q9583]